MSKRIIFVLTVLLSAVDLLAREPYAENPGSQEVTAISADWNDAARSRDVPVLICYPKDISADKPEPVIVFSHGLGGSRETYAAYGMHWASYGYVVIFPQHHGSDTAVIGHGMFDMLMGKNDLQAFIDRVGDIHFVLDQVTAINAGKLAGAEYAPLKGALDLKHIGMSGHSFGAVTTEAVIGETFPVDKEGKIADPRITAAIAMSGSPSRLTDQDRAFGSIKIPVFYLTGTQDNIGLIKAPERRVPYDHSGGEAYLVVFNEANHMTFAPRKSVIQNPAKEEFQKYIRESTTAFWDATLKNDPKAKAWLLNDFSAELGDVGVFEHRSGKRTN